ncbi:MAG: Flp pilus assembly complex ATPase component TadA [Alphaproteobacteria bacterium]|nr:Flp pilus assembly complex ATPase component TadA [Alphaproteobacteria bacterium]
MLGEVLVELGFISERVLGELLAESSGFKRFNPDSIIVDTSVLKNLPKEVASRYRAFPISLTSSDKGTVLHLAMADVYDVMAIDQIGRYFPVGTKIIPQVSGESDIQSVIDKFYGHELSIDGILNEIENQTSDEAKNMMEYTGEDESIHPLVRLVNAILLDAVKEKASDLHFEPEGNYLRLRYRIDGVMSLVRTLHKGHWAAISHRLKIMSGMNIADKLNPQDGRTSMTLGSRKIDFRVSSLPTAHGENIVLRILDQAGLAMELDKLGYSEACLTMIEKLLRKPEGIIIVTGPTGSGKTTSLYAMMTHINSLDVNIMTLEDPVEYELPLIRQAQVREGTSMTFSRGIRSILRQDPDVILVGEIRDSDTATMALRAAMTGHQVYTTLHTNDAAGAIPRLIDLGMRPALMSGNIIGVMAQRLARRLCKDCVERKKASKEDCILLGLDPDNPPVIGYAKGCDKCRNTGYSGRVAIAEVMPFNYEIDELIVANSMLSVVRKKAMELGFVPMADDGVQKVLDGIISIQSLIKAIDITNRIQEKTKTQQE